MHHSYSLKKLYNKYYLKEKYRGQEGPWRPIFHFPLEHRARKSHVVRALGFHKKVSSPAASKKSSLGKLCIHPGRLQLMANLWLPFQRDFHKALQAAGSPVDTAE